MKPASLATLLAASTLAFSGAALAAGPVQIVDIPLDTTVFGPGPAAGGTAVNLRLIDLGFTAGSGFDSVKNWVELQITTSPKLEANYPLAVYPGGTVFTAAELGPLGLGAYPTVGQVQGLGNLSPGEYADSFYLNINESAVPGFDYSKLKVVWTGDSGFPFAGARPLGAFVAKDGFGANPSSDGLFDVAIFFSTGALRPDADPSGEVAGMSSKLAFIYDDGNTDIDPNLFDSTSISGTASHVAFGRIAGGSVSYVAGDSLIPSTIAPVPEPETWLTLAVGLAGLGVATRRRKTRG